MAPAPPPPVTSTPRTSSVMLTRKYLDVSNLEVGSFLGALRRPCSAFCLIASSPTVAARNGLLTARCYGIQGLGVYGMVITTPDVDARPPNTPSKDRFPDPPESQPHDYTKPVDQSDIPSGACGETVVSEVPVPKGWGRNRTTNTQKNSGRR